MYSTSLHRTKNSDVSEEVERTYTKVGSYGIIFTVQTVRVSAHSKGAGNKCPRTEHIGLIVASSTIDKKPSKIDSQSSKQCKQCRVV